MARKNVPIYFQTIYGVLVYFILNSAVALGSPPRRTLADLLVQIAQEQYWVRGDESVRKKIAKIRIQEFDGIIDALKKEVKGAQRDFQKTFAEKRIIQESFQNAYLYKASFLASQNYPNDPYRKLIKETLKKASDAGSSQAKVELSKIYVGQIDKNHKIAHSRELALNYLVEAVVLGNSQAMGLLAKDLEFGFLGGAVDCVQAYEYYKKAAGLGDLYSISRLANFRQEDCPGVVIAPLAGAEKSCPESVDSFHTARELVASVDQVAQLAVVSPALPLLSATPLPVLIPAELGACCEPIELSDPPEKYGEAFNVELDPYTTGQTAEHLSGRSGPLSQPSWRFGYGGSAYFSLDRRSLNSIGGLDQIKMNIPYKIPQMENGETEDHYYSRRARVELANKIPVGKTAEDIITFVGSGAFSRAYLVHEPAPSNAELAPLYPIAKMSLRYPGVEIDEARRRAWATTHSTEVVKFRRPSPHNKVGAEADEYGAKFLRRDIAVASLFDTYAKRYSLVTLKKQRKPVVELVKYRSTPEEMAQGLFLQEAVQGETAWQVTRRIRRAMAGDKKEEKYLSEELNFGTLSGAKLYINALENFYRQTHNDVQKFQQKNSMPSMNGYTFNKSVVPVGFDYNLGNNVMWDPTRQIFRAFDY